MSKYRIVTDDYCGYEVQKKGLFRFRQVGVTNTHSTIAEAQQFILRRVLVSEPDIELRDKIHALGTKHSRLLDYLGLEDVTEPERKLVHKKRVVRAATKPKKQTKGKRVSP